MSSTPKTNQSIEAITAAGAAVDRVTGLIRNVLLKFPDNTLPPALKPFTWRPDRTFRLVTGQHGTVVVLNHINGVGKPIEFPAALLGAQESEITRWARTQYWSHIRLAKDLAQRSAQYEMEAAQRALDHAQGNLDRAAKTLKDSYAPTKKQRRARRIRMAPAE